MNRRKFLALLGLVPVALVIPKVSATIPPIPPCGKCTPYSDFKITTERLEDEQAFIGEVNEKFEKAHRELIKRMYEDMAIYGQGTFKLSLE